MLYWLHLVQEPELAAGVRWSGVMVMTNDTTKDYTIVPSIDAREEAVWRRERALTPRKDTTEHMFLSNYCTTHSDNLNLLTTPNVESMSFSHLTLRTAILRQYIPGFVHEK